MADVHEGRTVRVAARADGGRVPPDLARRGRGEAGELAQQAGLAGSVGAAHVQALAGRDAQVQSLEQALVAARAGELGTFQQQ
jgi:hypothetical protein